MKEYKYSYQDWLDGNILGDYSDGIREAFHPQDLMKIEQQIKEAAIKKVNDLIKVFRRVFLIRLNMTLVKDDVLSEWISKTEHKIREFKDNKAEAVLIASLGNGTHNFLSGPDVKERLLFDADKAQFNDVFNLYNKVNDGDKAIDYIIHVNFLKWLYWFKAEQLKDTSEPFVYSNLSVDDENQFREVFKGQTTSYKWQSKPNEELPILYQCLKANQLIHIDTTLDQFMAVFKAKPLKEIQPIDWIGAKNLLAYFVDSIYNNRLIHFNINQWSVAENCFTNAKDLAQSKDRYLDNKSIKHPGKPKNYHLIDEVIKGLN